jgi:lysophospholipase L1-like esterase
MKLFFGQRSIGYPGSKKIITEKRKEQTMISLNKNTPRGPFKSLVVLGESTVEGGGWLACESERWADVLWRLLEHAQEEPVRYYNAGIGASVISPKSPGYADSRKPSAAERLDAEVIAHEPDLVIIAYGLNDMRSGMDLELFKSEYVALLARLRAAADPLIVVVNVYYMPEFKYYAPFDKGSSAATRQYNEMLKSIAEKFSCVYADVWSAQGERNYVVNPDTVHANKIGNLLIGHKVFEVVVHAAPGIARKVQERDSATEWTRGCLKAQGK